MVLRYRVSAFGNVVPLRVMVVDHQKGVGFVIIIIVMVPIVVVLILITTLGWLFYCADGSITNTFLVRKLFTT